MHALAAVTLDTDILAPLVVALVVALLLVGIKLNGVLNLLRTERAEHDKLVKQLEGEVEAFKHGIKQIRGYSDAEVERKEQEVERLHGGLDSLGVGLHKMEDSGTRILQILANTKRLGEAFKRLDKKNETPAETDDPTILP